MRKTNGEVERRVNMALMAKQVSETHYAIYGNREKGEKGWLTEGVEKNTNDIKQIKTVWTTVTALWTVVSVWIGKKL